MDHRLPAESARRVAKISEVDTATVLLAAFGILLQRYTGKTDLVVVGTIVDAREEVHRISAGMLHLPGCPR